jgi:hypothetical protein
MYTHSFDAPSAHVLRVKDHLRQAGVTLPHLGKRIMYLCVCVPISFAVSQDQLHMDHEQKPWISH